MAEINIGNNANLLKGAVDSHDTQINNDNSIDNSVTNNTTNNVVNNTTTNQTIYQAQRTQQEILQDNENAFIKAVRERVLYGITNQVEAELSQIALDWKISPDRARQIIEAERKYANVLFGGMGNEYYINRVLQDTFDAVGHNNVAVARKMFKTVSELSGKVDDANVQYYYYMLFASFNPAGCAMSFVSHHVDNYWQFYWTCVAYIKLRQAQNVDSIISRLGALGALDGDVDLLIAVENVYDVQQSNSEYSRQCLQNNLQKAVINGMSEQLSPLWYAVKAFSDGNHNFEEWFAFYAQVTLSEINEAYGKGLGKPTPPPLPKFNQQSVTFRQSQGWNPLHAAQQAGLGQMPSMQDVQAQLEVMKNQYAAAMQQMPQVSPNLQAQWQNVPPMKHESAPESKPNDSRLPQYGIIFTDTNVLAEKYGCYASLIKDLLDGFIRNSAEFGHHWVLLDIGECRQQISEERYWTDYNDILAEYIQENRYQTGLTTPVFIIGGDDVIPIPQLENPMYNDRIPTDMAYCFYSNFFSDLWDGDRAVSASSVRNTVARLPLERGSMRTTVQDDLQSYFNLCCLAAYGIEVNSVVMASNANWTANSVTMSRHLPLVCVATDDCDEICERMYKCPKLVAVASGGLQVDEKVLYDYKQSIQEAGMLLFNLHGSDVKGMSGFYCNCQGGYPESFNIDLMKYSNARVLNTVACFGARYDGYERNDSMLMSSLFGGGKLLYAGSTVSVPMLGDSEQTYPCGVVQSPGSGSEKFVPIYCYYQFCGLPAGEAMMRAKLDYFNTFRHIERDDFSLATTMMFGLYGNPMLHLKPRRDVADDAMFRCVLPKLPNVDKIDSPVRMKKIRRFFEKDRMCSEETLLSQIRNCVDGNMSSIHQMVNQNLYNQLNLDPRWLDAIDEFSIQQDGSGALEDGYIYNYDNDNKYGRRTIVEVDKQGSIKRVVTFK